MRFTSPRKPKQFPSTQRIVHTNKTTVSLHEMSPWRPFAGAMHRKQHDSAQVHIAATPSRPASLFAFLVEQNVGVCRLHGAGASLLTCSSLNEYLRHRKCRHEESSTPLRTETDSVDVAVNSLRSSGLGATRWWGWQTVYQSLHRQVCIEICWALGN